MCGGGDKPKQTAEEKELGRIAVERWNDYQVRFKPIEDQYINDVQMTDSDFNQVRGSTATSVQQAFSGAETDLTNNLFASGVDPSSGAFIDALDGVSQDRGLSLGTGINEAENAVDNAHVQGLQNVVAMGQGQATQAIDGMGQMAGNATNEAINRSNNSFQERSAGLQLAGTVAGAGTAMYMNSPSSATPDSSSQFYREPNYIANAVGK